MGSLLKKVGKYAGKGVGRRLYTWLHPEYADKMERLERVERAKRRAARRATGEAADEGSSKLKTAAKWGAGLGVAGGALLSDPVQFNVVDPIHYHLFSGLSPEQKAQPGAYPKWQNKKHGWGVPETEVDEESIKIKKAKERVDKSQPAQQAPQQTQQPYSSADNMDLSIYLED